MNVGLRTAADGLRGVCRECWAKLPCRSAESRQAEKRRKAEKIGRPFLTRDELRVIAERKREEAKRAFHHRVLLGLFRAVFNQKCIIDGERPATVVFRWRYRHEPTFRDKEIARRWATKIKEQYRRGSIDDGTLDSATLIRLFAEATHCCYCGDAMRSQDKTLDHMRPRSQGGAHSITNVVVSCRRCNARKHTMPLTRWLRVAFNAHTLAG